MQEGVSHNTASFEQILGFPGLFHDTGNGMSALAELKDPIPNVALSASLPPLPHLSSVDRGYFNLLGNFMAHSYRDERGNTYSVVQTAPMTQAQLHVPGSANCLEIIQTGRGADTTLRLAGDANRVGISQSGPATKIKAEVNAHAADISINQTSTGATLIFSGTITGKGTLSVRQ